MTDSRSPVHRVDCVLHCLCDLLRESDGGHDAVGHAVVNAIHWPTLAEQWPPSEEDDAVARWALCILAGDDRPVDGEHVAGRTKAAVVALARRLADVGASLSLLGEEGREEGREEALAAWKTATVLLGFPPAHVTSITAEAMRLSIRQVTEEAEHRAAEAERGRLLTRLDIHAEEVVAHYVGDTARILLRDAFADLRHRLQSTTKTDPHHGAAAPLDHAPAMSEADIRADERRALIRYVRHMAEAPSARIPGWAEVVDDMSAVHHVAAALELCELAGGFPVPPPTPSATTAPNADYNPDSLASLLRKAGASEVSVNVDYSSRPPTLRILVDKSACPRAIADVLYHHVPMEWTTTGDEIRFVGPSGEATVRFGRLPETT